MELKRNEGKDPFNIILSYISRCTKLVCPADLRLQLCVCKYFSPPKHTKRYKNRTVE
jgi:hypothetical protein